MTKRRRTTSFVLAGLGGAVLAVFCVILILGVTSTDPLPELTTEEFEAAWERWEANTSGSYDIEIKVIGRQPAVYRVEVRNKEVTVATRNGCPLKGQRTMTTWSVPGMFNTIEIDLDNRAAQTASQQNVGAPRLLLRALFHGEYGFPEEYRRIELGAQMQVDWKVTEFCVIP